MSVVAAIKAISPRTRSREMGNCRSQDGWVGSNRGYMRVETDKAIVTPGNSAGCCFEGWRVTEAFDGGTPQYETGPVMRRAFGVVWQRAERRRNQMLEVKCWRSNAADHGEGHAADRNSG